MLRSSLIAPLVLLATAATVVGGAAGWGWLCLVGLLVVAAGEPLLVRHEPDLAGTLAFLGLGLPSRVLICLGGVVMHSERNHDDVRFVVCLVVLTTAALVARAVYLFLQRRIVAQRKLPIETRNLEVPTLVPPRPVPSFVLGTGAPLTGLLALVPQLAALVLDDDLAALWAAGIVALLAIGALTAVVLPHARWRLSDAKAVAAVNAALAQKRPDVLLYFGDNELAAYQVDMWLETLERLDRPAAIVVRHRKALDAIATTSLPIVCAPAAVTVMALDLDAARVALYVANVGNNIHLLRDPGILSTFIGHGDSDKNASANPYAKVYDEIWVAGEAGRQRYATADVGVRDASIVAVGRPQLDGLTVGARPVSDAPPTLLYAPTWEGWNTDQEYGSVPHQGVALVEAALACDPPVRVVYKPHPFTGRRDAATLRAHRAIVTLLEAANAARAVQQVDAYAVPASGSSAVEHAELKRDAGAAFFAVQPAGAHLHIDAHGPDILATFHVADLLVTDVSSVLSDFLATGRPVAVCNTTAEDAASFVARVPAAAAGTVVARDGSGIDEVLAVLTGELPDRHAADRAAMRAFSLGDGPGQQRFAAAVDALVARSDSRR